MTATICAACSALEMISRREDDVATLVLVVVRVLGNRSLCLHQNGLVVIELAGDTGYRFEAGTAKAGGIEAIGGKPAQDVIRHDHLLAPAGPFVEMAFGHAALIIAAAPGTLLGMTKANVFRLDDR
jgi:hypothetical protein